MSNTPKTIQIFLPTGIPDELRSADLTTRIVKVFEVPRSQLDLFFSRAEAKQVGVYFLVNKSEEFGQSLAYIGQSGDLISRLTEHNKKKDFWTRALVAISLTNNLTQTHALYLEWLCISLANSAKRYKLENGNAGSRPHTPEPLEADCIEIFETIKILTSTLGHPIFSPIIEASAINDGDLFYCTGSGGNAVGEYTANGFVVLKDSQGRTSEAPSYVGSSYWKIRQSLISTGVLSIDGDKLTFTENTLFESPSAAATAVMGRSANGWLEWKRKDGKTLDEIKRKN